MAQIIRANVPQTFIFQKAKGRGREKTNPLLQKASCFKLFRFGMKMVVVFRVWECLYYTIRKRGGDKWVWKGREWTWSSLIFFISWGSEIRLFSLFSSYRLNMVMFSLLEKLNFFKGLTWLIFKCMKWIEKEMGKKLAVNKYQLLTLVWYKSQIYISITLNVICLLFYVK